MINNLVKTGLGLVTAALLVSPASYAVTVSSVGSFNNPTASSMYFFNRTYNQDDNTSPAQHLPSNLHSTTDSVAYFGWGIDTQQSLINREIIQSHFWFNGAGSVDGGPAASADLGTAFSLGSFTYTNQRTILSGGIVNIDFQMDINIGGMALVPIEYQLEINNTANNTTPSYDIARLVGTPTNISYVMNGTQYLLTFNGFSRDGGQTFESVAYLAEGAQTTAQIYATITAVVPVPATFWLLGSGLLAMAGLARSRK